MSSRGPDLRGQTTMRAMPNTVTNQTLLLAIAVSALGFASGADPGDKRPLVGPATGEEVAQLILDLGDRDYDVRTFATRRLTPTKTGCRGATRQARAVTRW